MATEQELYDEIVLSVRRGQNDIAGLVRRDSVGGVDPGVSAEYRRIARTQYSIYLIYQVLLIVLAVLALALLIWAGVLVARGEPIQAVLSGVAGIVTGGGAGFLTKERNEAAKSHRAALKAWRQYVGDSA